MPIITAFQSTAFQNDAFQIVNIIDRPGKIKRPLRGTIPVGSLRVLKSKTIQNRRVD